MKLMRWLTNLRHRNEWQANASSKAFKDHFAGSVESKLRKGRAHRSLGSNLFDRKYGEVGKGLFQKLVGWGLKPQDLCVDYGCGTLRVGIHLIKYLSPGCYWGLEISDFLLQEGRKLIGNLDIEKRPNLRIISAQSITEVAATKPAMLLSAKVLIHVHPDELTEYLQNIMKIIGISGQAYITGKWSATTTIRYSEMSWAHGLATIQDIVKTLNGTTDIIEEKERTLHKTGLTTRSGILRLTHARSSQVLRMGKTKLAGTG